MILIAFAIQIALHLHVRVTIGKAVEGASISAGPGTSTFILLLTFESLKVNMKLAFVRFLDHILYLDPGSDFGCYHVRESPPRAAGELGVSNTLYTKERGVLYLQQIEVIVSLSRWMFNPIGLALCISCSMNTFDTPLAFKPSDQNAGSSLN